jgi:hypothetical protein
MRVFRALARLTIGVQRYEAFLENRLKPQNVDILIRRERIVQVKTPPLMVMLPEYEELFCELGIATFEELFDCELADVSDIKAEALALFQPENGICKNCRR